MKLYSVYEAANELGVTPRHLRRLLVSGKIKGQKLGHDWVVLDLKYKRKRRPKGGKK